MSGLQGLKHEARLKEVKYLEVVWLCGSEANRNYSRRTLQTGEGWRERGSEWGKIGVRQRKGVKFRLFSLDAVFGQVVWCITCWSSLFGNLFLSYSVLYPDVSNIAAGR